MAKTLTAAAIQFNIALGDVESNLAKAEAAIRRVAVQGAKLAVLPEMWSTGYDYPQLDRLAEQT